MADKYCRLAARASEWMARTEDIPQFLKGTANADEAWFSLSALSQPTQEKFQNKNPDRALPPTQIIERIHRRTNLLTNFGFRIDVLKSFNQRGIFGTQFFAQFVYSLKQLIEFLGITRLVSLLHLGTELGHFAIDSGLGLVAADYFEELGHLWRGRLLSLRTYWRGGDHQNGNNQLQVHEYLLKYAACDDDA
jgi:hypothetical protein